MRRLAHSAVASVRPLYLAEAVERRLMLVTFNGTAAADVITVDISGGNIIINNFSTGAVSTTSDLLETQIIVNGQGGADTISVLRNGANATTINAGAGDDTVTVGNTNFDANINANVVVDGGSEADVLTISDTADVAGNDASTMTASSFKKTAVATTVSWTVSGAGIVETVNVNLGGQSETVSVLGTDADLVVNLNAGSGNDTVTVGNDFDTFFFGPITVAGGGGTDSIIFDDTGDTTPDTYLLDVVGANGTLTKTTAVAAAVLSYNGNESVRVDAPAGALNHTFNVLNLVDATTINAGDGADILNYGNGVADLELSNAALTFNGQAGSDTINFNDSNNSAPDTYTITATTAAVAGTGTLTYATSEVLTVNGGTVGNTFNVNGSATSTQIAINAAGGNDTILISGGTDTVAAGGGDFDSFFGASVGVSGGTGTDSLVVNDLADGPGSDVYTTTATQFDKNGSIVSYASSGSDLVEFIKVIGSNQPSTYNILSTSGSATSYTIDAGTAADTIIVSQSVNTLNAINGALILLDSGGIDAVTLSDTGSSAASTYTMSAGNVFTSTNSTGSVDLSSAFETVTLAVNTATALAQTFNVNALSSIDLVVSAGLGNDTLNFGGGDITGNITNATVSFDGGGGTDRIVVDDSGDPIDGVGAAETYTLTSTSLAKTEATGSLLSFSTSENLVATLTPFADQFNVASMLSTMNVTVNGGNGNDTVDAATSNDIDNTVVGSLTFNGDAGIDRLDLDDTGDSADSGENYIVTSTSFIKTSAAPFGTLTYGTIENIDLIGNGGNNILTSQTLLDSENATLNGGGGNDTLNTSTNDLNNLFGDSFVAFQGGAGTDVLSLNDSAETGAPLYAMTADTLTVGGTVSNGTASIGIDTVETFNLTLSDTSTTINITGIDGETINFVLNAGAGNDTVNVTTDLDDAGDLGLLNRTSLVFNGEAGTDVFNVTDTDNEVGDDVYRTGDGTVTKDIAGNDVVLTYATMESLTLTGSTTLASTYQLDQLPLPTTINGGAQADLFVGTQPDFFAGAVATINAGDGNDTLQTGGNGAMGGLFVGGVGTDSIGYDDSAGTLAAGNAITIDAGVITRPANFSLSYDTTLERLEYTDNASPHIVNILSTIGGTTTLNCGDGDDTVFAGKGDLDANLFFNVTLNGNAGNDVLNFIDNTDGAGGDTAILGISRLTKGGQFIDFNSMQSLNITGSPQATVYTLTASDAPVTINAGGANDTINLGDATTTVGAGAGDIVNTVSVNGGDGADTINLGNGDLDEMNGFGVTIAGSTGIDVAVINDALDTGPDSYDFVGSNFTKTGGDFVSANVTSADYKLFANDSANVINYNSGSTGELNGNGGADTFNVISSVNLVVHGGAGLDIVKVNEDAVGTAVATFDQNEDLDSLEIYVGGTATVATSVSGNTLIDTDELAVLRGTLNVNNNFVIVRTPGIPALVDKLTRGFNAGTWNGAPSGTNGVINSAYANTSIANDGVGYIEVGAGDGKLNLASYRGANLVVGNLIISHLLNGDVNFDRAVNFDDLVVVAQNYNFNGKNWAQGNFDYDALGNVGFPDLVAVAQNYSFSLLSVPAAFAAPLPRSLNRAIKGGRNADILSSLRDDVLAKRVKKSAADFAGQLTDQFLA